MNTLRYHILFILFIVIAFSTGCDDNTSSQNNNNPPQDTVTNPIDTSNDGQDTIFLASKFKKVTITYSNVLVIGKHELLTNGDREKWNDTLLWSYKNGYGTRGSDRGRVPGLSIFTNTNNNAIYGNTGFSGFYLKGKNEIGVLSAGYYSRGFLPPEDIYSSISIRLYNLPFVYQQDSSVSIALTGREAEEYMFYFSYYNDYHRDATSSHYPEAEENHDYTFYKCTDSTQIEITIQR